MQLPDFLTEWPFGEIVLTGHRIGLYHVIAYHREGYTTEMLHELFPTLPLDLIEKVLTFARENQSEVDAYVDRCQAEIDEQRRTGQHLDLEEIKRRLVQCPLASEGLAMQLPDFLTEWPFGEIVLTGHRIGLFDVMYFHNDGYTAEMLHDQFPTLPLDLIEKVLAFARANRAEVDDYVREYQEEIDRQRAAAPRVMDWEQLRAKFEAMKRAESK